MTYYLGVDIGTSAIKVILLDADQQIKASCAVPLAVSRPRPGWSEQDPKAWWQGVDRAISQIAGEHPGKMAELGAIGMKLKRKPYVPTAAELQGRAKNMKKYKIQHEDWEDYL